MSNTDRSYKRRGARYKARRRAVDILFEAEARDVDPVAVVEDRMELSKLPDPPVGAVAPYTRSIVEGVAVELDNVDNAIARFLAEDWTLPRIPAVDRAIMRVSAWELLYNPEVPPKTAVVEGIELASEYSTDVAPPYINAVLDDIMSQADTLRAEFTIDPEESAVETPGDDDIDTEADDEFADADEDLQPELDDVPVSEVAEDAATEAAEDADSSKPEPDAQL